MDQKSKFETIFELTARGFSTIDSRTGQIIQVNQRFRDLFGLKDDDLLIHPVPVNSGDKIYITVDSNLSVSVSLYDMVGPTLNAGFLSIKLTF